MNKTNTLVIAGLVALLIITGCRGGGINGFVLDGTGWKLVEIEGAPALPGSGATIEFEGAQISGKAGCNQFFGEVKYGADGSIDIRSLGSTLMACLDEALMEQETAYMRALGYVAAFEVQANTLTLMDSGGVARLVFERAAID